MHISNREVQGEVRKLGTILIAADFVGFALVVFFAVVIYFGLKHEDHNEKK